MKEDSYPLVDAKIIPRSRHFMDWLENTGEGLSMQITNDDDYSRRAVGEELTDGIEKMSHQIDHPDADRHSQVTPSPLDEREQAQSADYEWALMDADLPKTYGGMIVAVSNRRVWGAGRTYPQAREAAKQAGCPVPEDFALVPVARLSL